MQDTILKRDSFLDRQVSSIVRLDWERTLYLVLIVVALATRFWGLGWRAMSHDESLHVVFSHKLYAGQGYQHDPMMHGPFLFHANALMYFLFGPDDFTSRIVPALFGVALVAAPWWMRRWLGRIGALACSFMFLISPTISYYSRYIRNEPYILLFCILVIILIFKYLETRQKKLLFGLAAVLSLMFAAKEVAFIFTLIVGLILAVAAFLEWWKKRGFPPEKTPLLDLVVVIGTLTLPLATAAIVEVLGFQPLDYSSTGIIRSGIVIAILLLISAGIGLWWDRRKWPILAAIYYVIFILLFTTFFTNGKGLATGFVGSLGYWIEQHEVQRGDQPWYYYGILLPLYEFMPLLLGLAGIAIFGAKGDKTKGSTTGTDHHVISAGRFFMPFMITFTLATLFAYSFAGEKMPWLTVHLALPLIILAGWTMQQAVGSFDWRTARARKGALFGLGLLLFIFILGQLFSLKPFRGQDLEGLSQTLGWLAALALGAGLVVLLATYAQRLGWKLAGQTAFTVLFIVLSLFTFRVMWRANYINYDYATEHLVYAHATPDIKLVVNDLDHLSRRLYGDRSIRFAYDDATTWPFEWYFRDFPNSVYYGAQPSREALDAPVVLVGDKHLDKVQPILGNRYYRFTYKLVWWPLEDYRNLTWSRLWSQLTSRDELRKLWDVFFYRKFDYSPADWPLRSGFSMFVRRDVADQVWDFGAKPPAAVEPPRDIYLDGMRDVAAQHFFGQAGSEPGMLKDPRNVAVGADGLLYVLDAGNHRVQVFTQDGAFVRGWGGFGTEAGQLNDPWGIAAGPDGSLYVADTWNHRIVRFNPEGQVISMWRDAGSTAPTLGDPAEFWGPRGITVDTQGNVYVAITGVKRVQKFSADGEYLGEWGEFGLGPGQFDEPVGITADPAGNIYIADTWNQRIQVFDSSFSLLKDWPILSWEGQSILNKPYLVVGSDGRLYISDPEGYRILVYDLDGNFVASFGTFGYDARSFILPIGVAADAEGHIFVADSGNNRIMRFAVLP